MPVIVKCPHCGQKLNAHEGALGQTRACPKCRKPFDLRDAVDDDLVQFALAWSTNDKPHLDAVDAVKDDTHETLFSVQLPNASQPPAVSRPVQVHADRPQVAEAAVPPVEPLVAAALGMSVCLWLYMSPLLSPIAVALTVGCLCAGMMRIRRRNAVLTAAVLVLAFVLVGMHVAQHPEQPIAVWNRVMDLLD